MNDTTGEVSAEPGVEDVKDDGSKEVDLEKEIVSYGKAVKKIKFRKPLAGDIIRIGVVPLSYDIISDTPSLDDDQGPAMDFMLARLSNVPSTSIATMESVDRAICVEALSPFFWPSGLMLEEGADGARTFTIGTDKLTLRKPLGGDMARCGGNPVKHNLNAFPPTVRISVPHMHAMLQRLSDRPAKFFEDMGTQDWLGLAWAINDFFLPIRRSPKIT